MHKAMKGEVHAARTFFGYYRQALDNVALLEAQQKAEEERFKDVTQLTDEELEKVIWDSLEEAKKEEIKERRLKQSNS
jgi:hypothetical protein